jgi:hypothetical protein
MLGDEEIIRELHAAAEGPGTDIEKSVSMLSDEGYMQDVPSGMEFRGQAIGDSVRVIELRRPTYKQSSLAQAKQVILTQCH